MSLLSDSYISYVNMDHRKDRLTHIANELKKVGIQAERTRGIYPYEFLIDNPCHAKMRARTWGAIGCYEAQLNVMREALKQGKHAFVMEDDVVFCSDFHKRIEYIDNSWISNPGEWDIIWLGGTFHINPPYWHKQDLGRDAECTNDPRIIRTYGSFCTYSYIVNKYSLIKVVNMLEKIMHKSIGIDWSMIQLSPQLHTFAFVPGCCKQIDNESDQIPDKKVITEFSKFEKLNGTIENSRYWYQDKMEDFDPLTFDWAEAKIN